MTMDSQDTATDPDRPLRERRIPSGYKLVIFTREDRSTAPMTQAFSLYDNTGPSIKPESNLLDMAKLSAASLRRIDAYLYQLNASLPNFMKESWVWTVKACHVEDEDKFSVVFGRYTPSEVP